MAYERRRLSTESEKSSTSTTHSTESITTHSNQNLIGKKSVSTSTSKRTPTMSSPAEILLARTKNTFVDLNPYFQCSSLPRYFSFVFENLPMILLAINFFFQSLAKE